MKKIIYTLLIITLFSCGSEKDKSKNISVSILPLKYFVERITGDYLNINVMIPPGANHSLIDFSIEQMKALDNSSVYFAVGYLPFEQTLLYPLLKTRSDIQLVQLSNNMELIEGSCEHHHHHSHDCDHDHSNCGHDHGQENANFEDVDPHVWMSPRYVKLMTQDIYRVLVSKYPEKKEEFEVNYKKFINQIDSIDNEAKRIILPKEHKVFLIYHPALTYFARDYGMEQVAIEDEGKEPNPTHIKNVIDICRENDIKIVFIQNQFDKQNAISIASEMGGTVITIDPLTDNWSKEMLTLLDIFEKNMH